MRDFVRVTNVLDRGINRNRCPPVGVRDCHQQRLLRGNLSVRQTELPVLQVFGLRTYLETPRIGHILFAFAQHRTVIAQET